MTGRIDDHRHPDRRLVGVALVDQAVFAEHEAVVAVEDDHGVLFQAVVSQILEKAAQAVVHRGQGAVDVAHLLTKIPVRMIGEVRPVPAVALVLHPDGFAAIVLRRVRHRRRQGDFQIAVLVSIARRRHGVGMDGLVRQIQEEGLGRITPMLQPVHRIVRQIVGDIGALLGRHAIHIQHLPLTRSQLGGAHPVFGEVEALPLETDPTVKARARRVGVAAHMPFAEEARLIAGLLQIAREEDQPLLRRVVVVDHTVIARRLAGQNGRPAGRA